MKRLAILGCTGSVGRQTIDVAQRRDDVSIVAMTAHQDAAGLEELRAQHPSAVTFLTSAQPPEAFRDFCRGLDCDLVVNGISGAAGLAPTFDFIDAGVDVATANKESLVMAGRLLLDLAEERGCELRPIDSEHSAIWQALRAGDRNEIERIHLTASGGPFRGWTRDQLETVSIEEALAHPTWTMGRKISVDSATLMNKALELIEASILFGVAPDRIRVTVHPESIVHSIVEFRDGSHIAHLGSPDMRVPIAYAMSHPERWPLPVDPLDLSRLGALHFEAPDEDAFPSLGFARRALSAGNAATIALNAANEVAVQAFLDRRIGFLRIFEMVEKAIAETPDEQPSTLAEVLAIDRSCRTTTETWIP